MGFFSDMGSILGELNTIKEDIVTSFKDVTGEATEQAQTIKDSVQNAIDEVKK